MKENGRFEMQIILIRHGSTAGNLEQRYVGSTDEPLTENAKEKLRDRQGKMPVPEILFVSPMKRCVQTAELLYPGMEQRIAENLRECSFGKFEYKNYRELAGDADYQAWIDSGGILAFPGGESRAEFADRCCQAFQECCRYAGEKNCKSAAFVVHGGTIMAVMERFARPQKGYFDWQVKNVEGFTGRLQMEWNNGMQQAPHDFLITDVEKI